MGQGGQAEAGGGIRLALLEDEQLMRDSLQELARHAGWTVSIATSDPEQFLARVEQAPPQVALVDLCLGGVEERGLEVVRQLRERHPALKTLVLSASGGSALVEECLAAGAVGHLCKGRVGVAEVLQAVQAALGPCPLAAGPAQASLLQQLSRRERQVLEYLAAGADNLKIAAHLDITERTVRAHIGNLYRKLHVHNRTQMALLAWRLGVTPAEA
jgi:DNA-binding NarL/FixJ family response regulator